MTDYPEVPDMFDPTLRIKAYASGQERLAEDEYYATMICDLIGKYKDRDMNDFIDWGRGWIGLERPAGRACYLSKHFRPRIGASEVMVVFTDNASDHVILRA